MASDADESTVCSLSEGGESGMEEGGRGRDRDREGLKEWEREARRERREGGCGSTHCIVGSVLMNIHQLPYPHSVNTLPNYGQT